MPGTEGVMGVPQSVRVTFEQHSKGINVSAMVEADNETGALETAERVVREARRRADRMEAERQAQ